MSFTIKIDSKTPKAKSIINMLKELAKDYSFIDVTEDEDEINGLILQEVDARKEYMKKHPNEWQTWEEVKNDLLDE